jgi:hypothetical protein
MCGGYSAKAHQFATSATADTAKAEAIAAWNRRTPPTPATEEREAVARAERVVVLIALWAEYRAQSSEKLPVTIDDAHSRHRYLVSAFADAALSALREIRERERKAEHTLGYQLGVKHATDTAAAEILAAEANNDLARMVTTKLETLREAAQMIADDYQTSPKHHPNDILIPVASFHRLLAALTANHSAPIVEE